jgi:CBS domain-containing protein
MTNLAVIHPAEPTALAALKVEDLMSRHVHTAEPNDRLHDIHALMRLARIRHVPVLDGDKLVGIISDRDIHLAWSQGADAPARSFMTRYTQWVFADTPAREAAARMLHDKIGCLPVLDRAHRVVGIVTDTDFLAVAHRALTIHQAWTESQPR